MIIFCLIIPTQSIDCQTLRFEKDEDFQYFLGDFTNSTEDHYDTGKSSMKIIESIPRYPKVVSTQVAHVGGGFGTLRFRYKKAGSYPNFFNLIFYIDGIPYNCGNIGDWGKDPFYKKIDYNGNKSHELKWVLEHDGSDYIGIPKACAFIEDFTLCGDLSFLDNSGNGNGEPYQPYFKPLEGSLDDSFIFIMNRKAFLNNSEPILQIRNPNNGGWGCFAARRLNSDLDNITFDVLDLSFIIPPFLGPIEFQFIDGDKIIGPYKGPVVNLNLKDLKKDIISKTISVDALSSTCVENICLTCDNQIFEDRYNGCNNWQKLNFGPLTSIDNNLVFEIGVCDE